MQPYSRTVVVVVAVAVAVVVLVVVAVVVVGVIISLTDLRIYLRLVNPDRCEMLRMQLLSLEPQNQNQTEVSCCLSSSLAWTSAVFARFAVQSSGFKHTLLECTLDVLLECLLLLLYLASCLHIFRAHDLGKRRCFLRAHGLGGRSTVRLWRSCMSPSKLLPSLNWLATLQCVNLRSRTRMRRSSLR